MRVVLESDQWVTVGPPDHSKEFDHTMPAGLEIEAISVSEDAGESWVLFRVPGYEHVETEFPVRPGVCRLIS